MNNKIKKINLNHSFIFFFVVNIFCILLFKFNNFDISSILCLLLILLIGVSHGALDHIKGKKMLKLFNIKSKAIEDDFISINGKKSTHILNSISPAFTSSFSLADLILEKSLLN